MHSIRLMGVAVSFACTYKHRGIQTTSGDNGVHEVKVLPSISTLRAQAHRIQNVKTENDSAPTLTDVFSHMNV